MNLEIKDDLYYSDLMYKLKSLAGLEQQVDEETEQRIIEREEFIFDKQETGSFRLSAFEQELYEIVIEISRKVNVSFRSFSEISKYPELVDKVLSGLEVKKNLNRESNKFNVLATPNNGKPFVISKEGEEKLLNHRTNPETSQEIVRKAEEFKINNLLQKQKGPVLTKKI